MSKAILVMDMPEKCSECSVCHVVDGNAICQAKITGDSVEGRLTATYTKPDWCPLRELPEKKNSMNLNTIMESCKDRDSIMGSVLKQFIVDGYNACIDELLKGEEG